MFSQYPANEVLGTPAYATVAVNRIDYGLGRQMMPCGMFDPAPTVNLKPLLELCLKAAQVKGFTGGSGFERQWMYVGLDGALYLRARKIIEHLDCTDYNCVALLCANGHETWSMDGAILVSPP